MKGSNASLKVISNPSAYTTLGYLTLVSLILSIVSLLLGFMTPKFIGLESILTLQLLYYSRLLIVDIQRWPPGFSFMNYFKFTSGFNDIFQFTQYQSTTTIAKKLQIF